MWRMPEGEVMKHCKDCGRKILPKADWSENQDGTFNCGPCDDEMANPPTSEELNYVFGEGGWG